MRHYVTLETLQLLYYSLFYSFLSYGIVIWGLSHYSILDRLFKVQKRVIRAISFKDKYIHTAPLFYELKILKLHYIHSLKLLCFVYECTNNSITPTFHSYFNKLQTVHSYNTRQTSKGNIYLTTQYRERSAKYAGGIFWNNLSVESRKSPSMQTLKKSTLFICLFGLDISSQSLFILLLLSLLF